MSSEGVLLRTSEALGKVPKAGSGDGQILELDALGVNSRMEQLYLSMVWCVDLRDGEIQQMEAVEAEIPFYHQ